MSDRMDDVLSAIDDAVDDWDGCSADAARWTPPEAEPYELPTRVSWCPEIANPAAPTAAELDAGTDLTPHIARTYPPPGSMAAEVEALQERLDDVHRNLAERMGCTVDEVRGVVDSIGRHMVVPGYGRTSAFRRLRLEVTEREVRECARQIAEAAGVPLDVVGLDDPQEGEPSAPEEFRARALEARRNRNTGPQRPDNRRWRNT